MCDCGDFGGHPIVSRDHDHRIHNTRNLHEAKSKSSTAETTLRVMAFLFRRVRTSHGLVMEI